jgi:hypothetical protein
MNTLTGQIRHRVLLVPGYRGPNIYLVLQIEEKNPDGSPFWRDARTEDLTTITFTNLAEVKRF